MTWTPIQKLSVTSGAALLILGLAGTVAYAYLRREVVADQAVAQTNSNVRTVFRILSLTADAERFTKSFVMRPDSAMRRSLERAQSDVEDALDAMRRLTEDNPRQRRLLDEAAPNVAESFREFRNTVTMRTRVGADSARRYLMRESQPHAADSLRHIAGQMRDEELRVLAERTLVQSRTSATSLRLIQVATVFTFLLAALALQPARPGVAQRLSQRLSRTHLVPGQLQAEASRGAGSETRLQALHRLIAALATAHDPATGARQLVAIGAAPFEAAFVAVVMPNETGGISVLGASDDSFDALPADLAPLVADTLRTGEPVMAESRATRERRFGTLASLDSRGATGALLFAPLWRNSLANGVLLLAFATDRDFLNDDLNFASTLGRLGGTAVASSPAAR